MYVCMYEVNVHVYVHVIYICYYTVEHCNEDMLGYELRWEWISNKRIRLHLRNHVITCPFMANVILSDPYKHYKHCSSTCVLHVACM